MTDSRGIKTIAFVCITALSLTLAGALQTRAGAWEYLPDHTWVYKEGSSKLTGWHWIDGNGDGTAECYYMDSNGTLKTNTSIDGWQVNADGAWIQNGLVQTKTVTPGAHLKAGTISANAAPDGSYQGTSGSSNSGSVIYTPALARSETVSMTSTGANAPYHGKVWTWDDYYTSASGAKPGQISMTKRCLEPGCCNPKNDNGSYCELHTCKEPGCTNGLAISEYNAGYCFKHMKAHGIDAKQFASQDRMQRHMEYQAAVEADRARREAARAANAASSGSSSSGSGRKSTGSSYSSSYRSSGSGSYSSSSYYDDDEDDDDRDAYDAGYDDIDFNEDYDEDRYWRDWDYMSGVDDAMEDFDEDW